jgi:hypothetical protein
MCKNNRLTNLLLLVSIVGALALTSQEFVTCHDDLPDEFLDLAAASQNQILPVFAPHRNTHPIPLNLLKKFYFKRTYLHATLLRC